MPEEKKDERISLLGNVLSLNLFHHTGMFKNADFVMLYNGAVLTQTMRCRLRTLTDMHDITVSKS